jgi:hypothetical protein
VNAIDLDAAERCNSETSDFEVVGRVDEMGCGAFRPELDFLSIPGSAVVFTAIQPWDSALVASDDMRAVLPVPRAPEKIEVNSGRLRWLKKARSKSRIICCLPARWAGTSPKLGVNGFSRYSTKLSFHTAV